MTLPRLTDIEQRAQNATPAPWVLIGGGEYVTGAGVLVAPDDGGVSPENAEFIAHSRQDVPALTAAIRAVLELHKPVPMVPGIEEAPVCDGCENPGRFVRWPCPTTEAIRERLDVNP